MPIRTVFAAFARRDLDSLLDVLDPEMQFHAVTADLTRSGRPYVGLEGMREYFDDVDRVWEELVLHPSVFEQRGEEILVTGRVWARGEGRVVDSSAGWIFRLGEDGKVVYGHVYASATEAEEAVGAG